MTDTMRSRFNSVAVDLLASDERSVIVLAAIGSSGFSADVKAEFGNRIIDVGIREQAMIGVAGGLALEGMRPIVMSYAPFLVERPYEQIKVSLTHQAVDATLVSIGASWDASKEGRTHQAPEDVALMSALPGWTVRVPGTPEEAERAIRQAHAATGSTYIRLSSDTNESSYEKEIGRLVTLRRGSDDAPTVLVVGPLVGEVLEATATSDVTVLYTATPKPIDERGLRAAVLGTDLAIVEPYLEGTSSHVVTSALSDRAMRITSIGVTDPEIAQYGSPTQLRAAHGLDAAGIRSRLGRSLTPMPV